ncbi:hypothetical protein [Arthrobacter sp. Soil761]|uniref:hypothetical protein n=1 Tax=Arthrobacter sp. Soil761 TaxID=1736400 RepID=UPI0006F841FE|nr:hypothetical protein [Arthrobacter sp. Soil761]KRE66457.1 hypothetical protein ASG79_10700 [Arthrobacter sp. Soil761]
MPLRGPGAGRLQDQDHGPLRRVRRQIQKRAEALEKTATGLAGLRQELRTAFSSDNPGAGLQQVADQLISHPQVFAKLPANLQADLTALKNAAPADLGAQANKIKDTALNGGAVPSCRRWRKRCIRRLPPPARREPAQGKFDGGPRLRPGTTASPSDYRGAAGIVPSPKCLDSGKML